MHGFQAAASRGQTVDAYKEDAAIAPGAHQGFACPLRHFVVVRKHTIDLFHIAQDAVHFRFRFRAPPSGISAGHNVKPGVTRYGVQETAMPLYGGRRSSQSFDFNNAPFAFQTRSHVVAHHAPDAIVVGAHVGRVVVCVGFPIKQHHGDTFFTRFVDHRTNGTHLIGRYDEQIHAFVDEMIDLSNLRFVIVAGRCHMQVDVSIITRTDAQLGVEFFTPSIVRALGNAHDITPLPLRTSTDEEQ